MNENQRIVVVIGFLLIAIYAIDRAFIMPGIESSLIALQQDNEMNILSGSGAADDLAQAASDAEAQRLERRFRQLSVLNIFLLLATAASVVGVILLRSRREDGEFDEEWEEDEWDNEEAW